MAQAAGMPSESTAPFQPHTEATPFQPQTEVAPWVAWPFQDWVASLTSMDSMTLAMMFMGAAFRRGAWRPEVWVLTSRRARVGNGSGGGNAVGVDRAIPAPHRGDTIPAPDRGGALGGLAVPGLGGVLDQHGLDDLGDDVHGGCLSQGRMAPGS